MTPNFLYVDVGNLRVKIVWDDQGSKIAVYQTDGGNDLVSDMWKTKKSDLIKLFKGQDIDLEHLAENLQMISVKVSNLPVSWLLRAELDEKIDFARVMNRNYLRMVEFVKDATKTAEG